MKAAYKLAVGDWKLAPSEFWSMHPNHFWWLAEAHQPVQMVGKMTQLEVERIYDDTYDETGQLRPIHVRFPHLKKKGSPRWRSSKSSAH